MSDGSKTCKKPETQASEMNPDLKEALDLLRNAGPNPLLIEEADYWDRFEALMKKYSPDEDED